MKMLWRHSWIFNMGGSYKTEMKARQEEVSLVDRAIDFLAPYFEVDFSENGYRDRVGLPEIRVGIIPRYSYADNVICLFLNTIEGSGTLGHEVGHWLHSVVNPRIFRNATKPRFEDVRRHALLETVANYSAVIYTDGENPFENPEFELLELTDMNSDLPLNLLERVADFDSELLRLRGVN